MRLYRTDETDEGGEDRSPGPDDDWREIVTVQDHIRNDIITIMPLYEDDMNITRYYSRSGVQRLNPIGLGHQHCQTGLHCIGYPCPRHRICFPHTYRLY